MKVSLTNEQIFEIVYLLSNLYSDLNNQDPLQSNLSKYDKRFRFAYSRNIDNLGPIANDLIKARESEIPEYKEFEKKKFEIVKMYALKDSNGQPVSDDNENYMFPSVDDQNKAQEEMNKLVEDYSEAITGREKEAEIYNEILTQEIEVNVVQCSFESVPDNFPIKQLRVLIKETDDEIEAMI